MKVMSIFPRPLLPPLAARSRQTKACTTPPRSMDLVPVAPACLDTWMMLPLDPMGLAALTASKQTTGDPFMYKMMRRDQKCLSWTFVICRRWEDLADEKQNYVKKILFWFCFGAGYASGWGEIPASTMSERLNVFNTVAKCSAATPWHNSIGFFSLIYRITDHWLF